MLHRLRVPRVVERVFVDLFLSVFHLKGVEVYLSVLCHAAVDVDELNPFRHKEWEETRKQEQRGLPNGGVFSGP